MLYLLALIAKIVAGNNLRWQQVALYFVVTVGLFYVTLLVAWQFEGDIPSVTANHVEVVLHGVLPVFHQLVIDGIAINKRLHIGKGCKNMVAPRLDNLLRYAAFARYLYSLSHIVSPLAVCSIVGLLLLLIAGVILYHAAKVFGCGICKLHITVFASCSKKLFTQ